MYHEEIRSGLVSTFTYKCNVCDECVSIRTEEATEDSESVVNTSAVWGTLATGSSYAHLVERLSILDIPPLSGRHFFDTQRRLGFVSTDCEVYTGVPELRKTSITCLLLKKSTFSFFLDNSYASTAH
jgi:hypothetical protein